LSFLTWLIVSYFFFFLPSTTLLLKLIDLVKKRGRKGMVKEQRENIKLSILLIQKNTCCFIPCKWLLLLCFWL